MDSSAVRRTYVPWCHEVHRGVRSPPLLSLMVLSLLGMPLALSAASNALAVLSEAGASPGKWTDATSTYFGTASTPFVLQNGTIVHLPAPPLRVLALADWQNQRHTEFLSSWPNQSSLTLWANRNAVASYASRTTSSDYVYRAVWSTGALPAKAVVGRTADDAALDVVSAVVADLLGIGELDVVVQASDGSIWVLNHSSVASPSSSSSTSAFEPISIVDVDTTASVSMTTVPAASNVSTRFKMPNAPQLAVVPDVLGRPANPHTAQAALAFVNADDELVLLSRIVDTTMQSALQWPPRYVARVLVDEDSSVTQRAVLPLSLLLADVNEDCAAELLYAVRDMQKHQYEVYMLSPSAITVPVAAASAAVSDAASPLLMLQLAEDAGERYGETFTLADVNGDGLPELLLTVQLANGTSSCATVDTADVTETCTPYHAIRVFYPIRAAGFTGAPLCRPSVMSDEQHLTYKLDQSELFVLTEDWCGVADWSDGSQPAAGGTLSLYMPSYPSAPLVLRPGDYNRDRLADLIFPSSYGPLVLTSRSVRGGQPLTCAPLDAATGRPAVQLIRETRQSTADSTASREAYRTATPFFGSLAQLGQLDVVLTHHRRYASSATSKTAAITAADIAQSSMRVYQNAAVSSRSYFLSASAITAAAHGAACVGATHHMTWQDIHMRSHWATVTQLGRTQGHALLSAQVLVGLDETFSYVHDYTVGMRVAQHIRSAASAVRVNGPNATTFTQTVQRKEWPSYLVPNAAVFAQLTPIGKPQEWTLEMYLPTSMYRALLVTALTVALLAIGLPVVWLRCAEMRSDYNEWRTPL
ncbi:hypothetical protein LSCM1_03280 [Leishmania martiniquensis]|uniref:T-cell immunomodulatory protein TIP C2 domain-containing protein n=1 Tax=Leishmania martiniquensis TaxID=1580590 RepID=A0A836GIS4_9TRYP|nr:hypothetical protein LSCM1_03280 [Leishmania martiniquensis]